MEDFFVCRRKGVCAVAGYFLIYALSLRLPCSMNKIKKKKKNKMLSSAGQLRMRDPLANQVELRLTSG